VVERKKARERESICKQIENHASIRENEVEKDKIKNRDNTKSERNRHKKYINCHPSQGKMKKKKNQSNHSAEQRVR